jgi:hypothetical protein
MQRRTLLKFGLAATAVIAVAGGGSALLRPGLQDGRMTAAARAVFGAVARGVLQGMLPADPTVRDAALAAHLTRLDDTLAAFPCATQSELSQLIALIATVPGRSAIVGLHTDWDAASDAQLQTAMQDMRTSSLAMRQQIFHALRDLTNAAYFADPQAWTSLGYPGPQAV